MYKEAAPVDQAMYQTEGWERKNYRYDFANAQNLELTDQYVKESDRDFLNPDTTEMPHGPSGISEVSGGGVDFVTQEGDVLPTFRFNHGYTIALEEALSGADVQEKTRAVMEIFDHFADGMWMTGIYDRNGNQERMGALQWLKSSIPSSRSFDCSSTSYDNYRGNGKQSDILKYDAYSELSGRIIQDGKWTAIGRHEALAQFNKSVDDSSGSTDDTYWDRFHATEEGDIGIEQKYLIPPQLTLSEAPNGMEPHSIDLTSELGPDEIILTPNFEDIRQKYWMLHQMNTPEHWMVERSGGRIQNDFIWRYSHSFDPLNSHASATDSIHITNLSALLE
ncbi:hypothetical protein [Haladaptatus sp. CMAA 1909]|uniref:hypothetical protein n=1 Tax=Haladaptatus sp. CMAA 1909 TaxID=3368986 RepID=UPI0037553D70